MKSLVEQATEMFIELLVSDVRQFRAFFWAADKVHLVESFERTGRQGCAGEGSCSQEGRSLPLLVTVSLPCLTLLAVISSSAIFFMVPALRPTTITSRGLWWSRWTWRVEMMTSWWAYRMSVSGA